MTVKKRLFQFFNEIIGGLIAACLFTCGIFAVALPVAVLVACVSEGIWWAVFLLLVSGGLTLVIWLEDH